MKRILSICICLCIMFATFTYVAHAEGNIDVTLTSDRYGHIYTDASQGFKIEVKSNLGTDFDGKIVYSILSDGTSIYSEEKEVEIAAGGTYTDFPVIDFPKYGIFEITATVTDGTTVYGTDTISFSYINGSEAGEGNKKMLVNTHIEDGERNNEGTVTAIKDAGFGGLRSPVYWFTVEKDNKNEYEMPAFTESIKDASEMGMEPLVVLSGGNGPWGVINTAENNLNMAPDTDAERQAFANYCAYVATQLKGHVKYYEIWNEFTMSSNGGDQSPENYARLLVAASKAIKAADPDAKIVAMCTAGMDWSFINGVTSQLSLMGESDCYDILSVHPYTFGDTYGTPNTITLGLIKYLAGSKPIWFTERGWDTSTTISKSTNGISDHMQAVYGVWDYLTFVSSSDYCERYFWYDFQDDGTDAAEREDNFGLIESEGSTVPGAAKPSYIAFAAMNKLIGQSTYISKESKGGNVTAYKFTDQFDEEIYAIKGNVGETLTISMDTAKYPKIEVLDMYSNVVAIGNNSGSYQFTLTDEVMYVRKHYEPAGCTVTVSGDELIVEGHTGVPDKQVSLMVTNAKGEYVYLSQTVCDGERTFSFTADRNGENELYVKVNYGDLYNTNVETGIVLKLICNDERIFSLEEVAATDNLNLVISVNEEITTATDIHAAVYSGNELQVFKTTTLNPGQAAGDYSINIKLKNNNFDKIKGFVWENMEPVIDNVDFKKE